MAATLMTLADLARKLRDAALAYPGATEEFPWGERVIKVKGKVFVFLGKGEGELGLSVKLPQTAAMALALPFCEPTGYGLGKAGWVSASFTRAKDVPLDVLLAWLDESYRAVAPKTMVKELEARSAPAKPAARKGPATRAAGGKRPGR
jgi:predicted DNA-binding protein (MmcQ/YjbR family)